MSNILANSTSELNQIEELLRKDTPSYRQAYSDRTAWIMACCSELAYLRFNPLFSNEKHKQYFIDNITKLINKKSQSSLTKVLGIVGYDADKEKQQLINELETLNIRLIKTFDSDGTQAILVSFKKSLILAFRGTEATSIKDIKADAKANSIACDSGGNIHSGFSEAFDCVRLEVEKILNTDELKDRHLFITGHSLGGALATVAAKKLTHHGGLAACYTFGSPRVGDEKWIEAIKTPIYRLVNAADCVTMLPPSSETVTVVAWLFQFIPYIGKPIRTLLLSKLGGYLHCGNMRYLTNTAQGHVNNVKLLYSVSLFYRIKGLLIKKLRWKRFLGDHSMSVYRKKLMVIAKSRNIAKK